MNTFATDDGKADNSDNNLRGPSRRARLISAVRRGSKPAALALLTATAFLPGQSLLRPIPAARASAPIPLRTPMQRSEPPIVVAMKKAEKIKKERSLEEFDAFMAKCNDIEEAEGKKAREAYETQYQLEKAEKEAQKKVDVEKLKRDLLDKGMDPHTHLDAERKVFLLEHDVDLGTVPGTPQNEEMIKSFQKRARRQKKGSKGGDTPAEEHANQLYIVACQVADLKARGVDPMEHFDRDEVREKTRAIYKMDDRVAEKVAAQYRGLMEEHGGRLTPPKEGEVPFVYESAEAGEDTLASASASATSEAANPGRGAKWRNEKALARAARREQRAAEKKAAKEKRAAEKAEVRAEKDAAKEERLAEKAAAALAATEAAAAAGAASVVSAVADADVAATANGDISATAETSVQSAPVTQQTSTKTSFKAGEIMSQVKTHATPRNAATVLVGGGVAMYGINYYKENNGAAQSEREQQLKLILGDTDDDEDEDDDEFDDDEDDEYEQFTKEKNIEPPTQSKPRSDDTTPKAATPKPPPAPPVELPKPKPKRLGIFSKRKANLRETDLNALVLPGAQAPEFAALLAKILTFGAQGRFPAVSSWGSMPFDNFDLDTAKSLLTESRGDAGLTDEQSAEIFASVVNCMIIDIVDLASATLRGKDREEKVTVDAINVVMDFMDHAASLFDAVAQDVTIKPVTYGGKLRKKDLEQMFSVYAGSSMMSLDALTGGGKGATQDRVDTLQLVFAITDKKAEGLMQKHMMKMMMNLMKDGGKGLEGMPGMEGMEGMEEMMKAMGGADGGMLPGMDGGEMSPEDLKQTLGMMKDLMDSGQVSEEELKEVRSQFKEMYGSDISDLIKKASEEGAEGGMTDDERELLDMFKRILGEE